MVRGDGTDFVDGETQALAAFDTSGVYSVGDSNLVAEGEDSGVESGDYDNPNAESIRVEDTSLSTYTIYVVDFRASEWDSTAYIKIWRGSSVISTINLSDATLVNGQYLWKVGTFSGSGAVTVINTSMYPNEIPYAYYPNNVD